jgi:hypothetical protein
MGVVGSWRTFVSTCAYIRAKERKEKRQRERESLRVHGVA